MGESREGKRRDRRLILRIHAMSDDSAYLCKLKCPA